MPEINEQMVFEATAHFDSQGLELELVYSGNQYTTKRLPPQLEFGINAYTRLLDGKLTKVADENHPLHSPSAGIALLVESSEGQSLIFHRRDSKAPLHPLYHSINAGHNNAPAQAYSKYGLLQTAFRELAEETLLVTKDKPHWLILPKSLDAPGRLEKLTLETVQTLGLDFGTRVQPVNIVPFIGVDGPDWLRVHTKCAEERKMLFGCFGYLSLLWEGSTSLTFLTAYQLQGIDADNLIPLDVEGVTTSEGFTHFQRESYLAPLSQLGRLKFGQPLIDSLVYRAEIKQGKINLIPSSNENELLGPDEVPVNHPYIFAPDEMLTAVLGGLGLDNFSGKKRLEIELMKTRAALEGKSPLPP